MHLQRSSSVAQAHFQPPCSLAILSLSSQLGCSKQKQSQDSKPFYKLSGQKLDISPCRLVTEQNSLISCVWRSNRFDVFCKILLKLDFLFTDFFLAAIPINSQIPLFLPGNLPTQNCSSEMWLKMAVIYLMSLHLGVLYLHLSKLRLFAMVPSETF